MRAIAIIFAVLAILAGFISALFAFEAISILADVSNASAVQITQVYSEASFYVLVSIASFLFAVIVSISNVVMAINKQTETIQYQIQMNEK